MSQDLATVAERLAVCFASGRVDIQTSAAVKELFPCVETFSLAVLAGGTLLITAEDMLTEGCISVSFLRLDNTAAGEAMLHQNSCHVNSKTLRHHSYVDAEKALLSGCSSFTSVPILSVLQPDMPASGPLVQAGMASLGAICIGSCVPVSSRQLTQLMALACLTSPFLSSYVSSMLEDLTSVFLAPCLARCLCGCGQAGESAATEARGGGSGGRGSCRDAGHCQHDMDDGHQSLTTSELDAEDLYVELLEARTNSQVQEGAASLCQDGASTLGRALLDLGFPAAGSVIQTPQLPAVAQPASAVSDWLDSSISLSDQGASGKASSSAACASRRAAQDDKLEVCKLGKLPVANLVARQTSLLTFEDPALEERYIRWHGEHQGKVDILFTLVTGAVLAVCSLEPYKFATQPMAASMLVFLLPCLAMAVSTSWYLKHRESIIAGMLPCLFAAHLASIVPMFLSTVVTSRLRTPAWMWRMLGCECATIVPLGYMVRLRTFMPMQLVNVAVLATGIPRAANALFATTALATQARMLLFLATVAIIMPSTVIYTLERQSRRTFLTSLAAAWV